MMRVGVFGQGSWGRAWSEVGNEVIQLAVARDGLGDTSSADLPARTRNGAAAVAQLGSEYVDVLVDMNGLGLGFVAHAPSGPSGGRLRLAHEAAGKLLYSYFVAPLTIAFGGLGWAEVWQALTSRFWLKAVADGAHAGELERLGVENVVHLSAAAADRPYHTEPLDPSNTRPVVSYIGSRDTSVFASGREIGAAGFFPGTLAQTVVADLGATTFFDIYYQHYAFATPPSPDDDMQTKVQKVSAYFDAKKYFLAGLTARDRDRFVVFCQRKLGNVFDLTGSGWDTAYGLPAGKPPPVGDEYFDHFRESTINLNFPAADTEQGLNESHFEITAAGGFMLCYDQPELGRHFEIGSECAVFCDEADLLDKVEYYLSHPEERAAIALAGQRRTLSHHLYTHRVQALLQMSQTMSRPPAITYSATGLQADLCAIVPEPDIILDCGANVGQTATMFRQMYPRAEIYSFEPVGSIFQQLRTRSRELRVHPVNKAVGDHDGTATMHLTVSPESNSLLGFKAGNPCAKWHAVVGQERVEVCTLDRWCEEAGIGRERIDLIKMDLQGGEIMALKGAKRLLRHAKAVYIEVFFVELYQDAPLFAEIEAFMTASGYRRHAIYPSSQPHNWGDALYVKVPATDSIPTPPQIDPMGAGQVPVLTHD